MKQNYKGECGQSMNHYLYIRILGFKVLSDPKDSASTTNYHDKNVNLSISIFPYLKTCSFKMHLFSILRSITYPPSTKQERMNNVYTRFELILNYI